MFCANNLGHERKDTTSSSQQFRVLIQFSSFFFSCARLQQRRCVGSGEDGRGGGVGEWGLRVSMSVIRTLILKKLQVVIHTNKTGHKDKINNRAKAMFALN